MPTGHLDVSTTRTVTSRQSLQSFIHTTSIVYSPITHFLTLAFAKTTSNFTATRTSPRTFGISLPDNHRIRVRIKLTFFSGHLQYLKVGNCASMSRPRLTSTQWQARCPSLNSYRHGFATITCNPASAMGQKVRPELAADAKKAQDRVNAAEDSSDSYPTQRSSLIPRGSSESTSTTLPSYSEQSDQPPTYSRAGRSTRQSNPPAEPVPRASPGSASNPPAGVSAASISAIMATSSSENDKMHSKRSKKVNDWNEDSTYKSKLAKMTGSGRNWNYFGADIEQYGNPFKRFGRKK